MKASLMEALIGMLEEYETFDGEVMMVGAPHYEKNPIEVNVVIGDKLYTITVKEV